MRARNELDRLAAAGRPLHAHVDAVVGAGGEDAIFERIVATDRRTPPFAHRRPMALALLAVVVLAVVAAVAASETSNGDKESGPPKPHPRLSLTGSKIQLAGYRFSTPAGFTASSTPCAADTQPDIHGGANSFGAAASAEGGCVSAYYLIAPGEDPPSLFDGSESVDVGSYQGYFVAPDSSGQSRLYVGLPKASVADQQIYLALDARDLTEEQLIAVAQSGLPASA